MLKETELKLNGEMLLTRTLRDAAARELRMALERAERAEQAQAKLQQELKQAQQPTEKKD
jgi:uncharacterized protein (UPF0335 family)